METAGHREPCDSRGSCTVLGAPGGESPPGDSTLSPKRLAHWSISSAPALEGFVALIKFDFLKGRVATNLPDRLQTEKGRSADLPKNLDAECHPLVKPAMAA
jgi:hypothetical protein